MDQETILALRKSGVRREVLKYLATIHPESSYPAEIAKHTGLSSTQVIGALRGLNKGYVPKNSLISCGLVEMNSVGGKNVYNISLKGLNAYNKLLTVGPIK